MHVVDLFIFPAVLRIFGLLSFAHGHPALAIIFPLRTALAASHNTLELTSTLSIPVNIHLGLSPTSKSGIVEHVFCCLPSNVTSDKPQSGLKGSSGLSYNRSICVHPCYT